MSCRLGALGAVSLGQTSTQLTGEGIHYNMVVADIHYAGFIPVQAMLRGTTQPGKEKPRVPHLLLGKAEFTSLQEFVTSAPGLKVFDEEGAEMKRFQDNFETSNLGNDLIRHQLTSVIF